MWTLKETNGYFVIFENGGDLLRIEARHDDCLRVTATRGKDFLLRDEPMIISHPEGALCVSEAEDGWRLTSSRLTAWLDAKSGALTYFADGKGLVRENEKIGRVLRDIDILRYRYDPDAPLEEVVGVDGARVKAVGEPYVDRKGFQTWLNLIFSEGEALYGLGQHEEGA